VTRDWGLAVTEHTAQWLKPMVEALLATDNGAGEYARFMESALVQMRANDGAYMVNVDFIRLGQLIRGELGWEHYPMYPLDDRAVSG
jgi:hypothetical protein